MTMAMNFGPPLIDFSALASLADPWVKAMERQREAEAMKDYMGLNGQPQPVVTEPKAPIAPAMAGGNRAMRMPADPEVERKFIEAAKSGGLTNPIALAALAAHVNAESGFDPANFTRTWSDPSESGKPGTSGGALSWRGDRLTKMLEATKGQDPVVAQAKYALVEDPNLTVALQNAKTPEEAHTLLAQSQRYAGYDRPGGENARRLALTQNYLGRVGGTPQPTVTEPHAPAATGMAAIPVAKRAQLYQLALNGGSQGKAIAVAEMQRLAAQESKVPPEIQEWRYARQHGLTTANSPTEYAREKTQGKDKGPTSLQEWRAAQDPANAGYAKYLEAERASKQPPTLEKSSDQVLGKEYAERFIQINKDGGQASSNIGNLKVMEKLTYNPDFYSGFGSKYATAAKRAAVAVGLAPEDAAAPNELFTKLAAKSVVDTQPDGRLGSGFSNADRDWMASTAANMDNSEEGNRAIIRMGIKVEERKKVIAAKAREFKQRTGRVPDERFDAELAEWAEKNPLFKEEIEQLARRAQGQQGPPVSMMRSPPPAAGSERKTSTGVRWSF